MNRPVPAVAGSRRLGTAHQSLGQSEECMGLSWVLLETAGASGRGRHSPGLGVHTCEETQRETCERARSRTQRRGHMEENANRPA